MHKKLIISITFLTMVLFAGLTSAAEMVNINKASAAAIQQNLIGIGPIKAEAIVSYRKKNGKYKSMDDLQNVTGIGPALIKKNKRYMSTTKGVVAGDDKAYAASKKQAGKSKTTGTKKSAKKSSTAKASTKTKSKTKTKKDSKTKVTAKPSKSAKKGCNGSTKTMSKAEKKACAKKKAKTKTSAKKTTKKKKPAKKKKTSKPAS